MKLCKYCKKEKDPALFSRDKNKPDGLQNRCKACVRAYQLQPHVMEIKRQAQRKYAATEKGKVAEAKHSPVRRKRIDELGRNRVYYAVRRKLKRQPCGICGDERAQAHHHDYSKPLDVTWLCAYHHAQEHKHDRRTA